jgi:uncharacterized protein
MDIKEMEELKEYLISQFLLRSDSLHGPLHWESVLRNGLLLASKNKNIDQEVLTLFSYIHDSKRVDEYIDIHHGERAANSLDYLERLGLINLRENQKELLYFAIKHHNEGKTSTDVTIGACWDSDRLELDRVGILPSINFFSTSEGKHLLNDRF